MMKLRLFVFTCLSAFCLNTTADTAIAHDGLPIYYEVHGKGDKFLMLGTGTAGPRPMSLAYGIEVPDAFKESFSTAKQKYIDELGDDYRLIFVEYPGLDPKMYTLTPATMTRDYLAVADAAGADEFAWAGFSWGCVCGLQIALRTERMKALACGGFPTLDGIYDDMRLATKTQIEKPTSLYGLPPMSAPESGRQFNTFYMALESFNDRAIQGALKMPRLSWIGDQDLPTLNGEPLTHMGQIIVNNKAELEELGWDVIIVPGKNHLDGGSPEVQVPIIKEWLSKNY